METLGKGKTAVVGIDMVWLLRTRTVRVVLMAAVGTCVLFAVLYRQGGVCRQCAADFELGGDGTEIQWDCWRAEVVGVVGMERQDVIAYYLLNERVTASCDPWGAKELRLHRGGVFPPSVRPLAGIF